AEGLRELALRASGRDEDIVGTILAAGRPVTPQVVARRVGAPLEAVLPVLESLVAGGKALRLTGADDGGTGEWLLAAAAYQRLREDVSRFLARYFESFPLRRWAPREELRAAVWPREEPRAFAAALRALARDGAVTVEGERVGLPGRQVSLSPEQERAVAAILGPGGGGGGPPPPPAAGGGAASAAGGAAAGPPAELLRYLVESDAVERVDEDLFFAREALEAARERVRRFLQEREAMTVADLRDLLGITRKYAVPLAEYFDRIHLTRRHGDLRRLA
ncbi:MAG: SelB C-terminal domain-containing protein, partial [Clostridia bacterium]|nr:SelB C-terminal domain-containing protein [Clostridia bacterium]